MRKQRVARLSKYGGLFLAEDNSVIIHEECKQSMWSCGYCNVGESNAEAMKWIDEIQNPNTLEERRKEMFLQQGKEMVLGDLLSCPLTREQVDSLFKLRDSFEG